MSPTCQLVNQPIVDHLCFTTVVNPFTHVSRPARRNDPTLRPLVQVSASTAGEWVSRLAAREPWSRGGTAMAGAPWVPSKALQEVAQEHAACAGEWLMARGWGLGQLPWDSGVDFTMVRATKRG